MAIASAWQLGDWEDDPSGDPFASMSARAGKRRAILNEPGNYYYGDEEPTPASAPAPPPDTGPGGPPPGTAPSTPPPAALAPLGPMGAPVSGGGDVSGVPAPVLPSLAPLAAMAAPAPTSTSEGSGVERPPELATGLAQRDLPASSRALQTLYASRGRVY